MLDVGRILLSAAARDPKALALVDGEKRLAYGPWLDEVLRLVSGLDRMGLKAGDRLLTILQNRGEAASLHWATQLAGIVVVPVNWRATSVEIDFVCTDAEPAAVVFEAVSAPAVGASTPAQRLPRLAIGAAVSGLPSYNDLLAEPAAEPRSRASADAISLMFYTSGTTGRGKGVPRRHRAERAAAIAHVAQNTYRTGEVTLGVMPLYHTMGVRSLLAMGLIGGAFVCQPRFDPGRALDLIAAERVSCLYLVPTLYHDLVAHPDFVATDTASVRKIGFAGAAMTDGLLQRIDAAFRPELFVNHYGSSEIYTLTIEQKAAAKPGSAGKAGLNTDIRVVRIGSTNPGDVTGTNEEGQIIAALDGDEAFEGYWRRPDADARALHAGSGGDRWYFTGDIGFKDADGDLFVTGRVDDMIITGGENVMPVEIESVLSRHPEVAEVAVAGLADERWGQRVTAFVRRSGGVTPAELDAHCLASGLAGFKRPRAFVFVQEIPKSPVGKILRRMLVAGDYVPEALAPTTGDARALKP
jgi:2-furoate---CoA ligase